MPRPIAVGVDGSDASLIALRWAVQAAAGRGTELLVVIALPPALDLAREVGRTADGRNRPLADQLAGARQAIALHAGGAAVRVEELIGSPTEVLLAVSDRVDLLVVGGHGYGGWRDHFSRAVTGQLAVRTRAAVCVVRAVVEPERRRIVVGFNGRTSAAAVRFAVAESARRGSSLLIVSCWQYPRDTRATSAEASGLLEQGAAAALQEIAADLRADFPAVAIDTVVRLGPSVDVLAEFADTTDMVVVGSPGQRGFRQSGLATLVVGSTAIGLLRRVKTPVVIVPHA